MVDYRCVIRRLPNNERRAPIVYEPVVGDNHDGAWITVVQCRLKLVLEEEDLGWEAHKTDSMM